MEENEMRLEAEGVLENVLPDIMFYLYEYRDEAGKWGETFKKVFNDMVDSTLKEMKEEEE